MAGEDSIELGIQAREAKSLIEVARALAGYELEPSGAAAVHARAYGEAVKAYTAALSATVKYLEEIKAGRVTKTWERDVEISDLWRKAQDALWQFDQGLAMRCLVKSQGWLDPSVWDSPEFKSVGVSIQDMRLALKEFYREHGSESHSCEQVTPDRVANIFSRLKENPLIAAIIVIAVVLGSFATFTDNIGKLWAFFGFDQPRYAVSAGGPVFTLPKLNQKALSACILTAKAQNSENGDPNACNDGAQAEIASQFCRLAKYARAIDSTTSLTKPGAQDAFELARAFGADGRVKYAWNENQLAWTVFSSITCEGK